MKAFYPVKRTVVINTKTERAFRGVLWRAGWRYMVLRNVEMIGPGREVTPVDGEVVVERNNVDFIQVVR